MYETQGRRGAVRFQQEGRESSCGDQGRPGARPPARLLGPRHQPETLRDTEPVLAAAGSSGSRTPPCSAGHQFGFHTVGSKWDSGTAASNLSTVAVMPVSEDVPLTAFALELKHALSAIGKPCPRPPEVPWAPASQSFQVLLKERSALPARLITLGGGGRCGAGEGSITVQRSLRTVLMGRPHTTGAV